MPARIRRQLCSKPVFWLLVGVLGAVSTYLAISFARELGSGPGQFHGTHYDFLAFYGAAHLSAHHQIAQIYDTDTLTQFQRTIIPHSVGAAGYMPFLNPPFVAVFLTPLALLSIGGARLLWLIVNLALITGIAYSL